MKKLLILIAICLALSQTSANAALTQTCFNTSEVINDHCQSGTRIVTTNVSHGIITNCECVNGMNVAVPCQPYTTACYSPSYYPNIACDTGYEPNANNTACVSDAPCSTCLMGMFSDWEVYLLNSSHERRSRTKTCAPGCVCTNCSGTVYEFRCASGYYGNPTNGLTGCTRCPDDGRSAAGTRNVNNCHKLAGDTYTDTGGTFEYLGKCTYDNRPDGDTDEDGFIGGDPIEI